MDFRYELLMHRYTHPETLVAINAEDMPWELMPEPVRVEPRVAVIRPDPLDWWVKHLDISRLQVSEIRADKIMANRKPDARRITLREVD